MPGLIQHQFVRVQEQNTARSPSLRDETYHSFMLDHATGALAPALRLAGDLHCALDSAGAGEAGLWDCVGGILLDDALSLGGRLNGVDCRPRASAGGSSRARSVDAGTILATDLDTLDWRRGLSGVDFARSPMPGGQFMRLGARQATPEHGHSVLEATVVLRGELIVEGEVYGEGGLVIGAPGERHRPEGGTAGPCVCFVARERRPFWRLS